MARSRSLPLLIGLGLGCTPPAVTTSNTKPADRSPATSPPPATSSATTAPTSPDLPDTACRPTCHHPPCLTAAVELHVGRHHACVKDAQHLACWGDNRLRAIADDDRASFDTPVQFDRAAGLLIEQVALASHATCFRLKGGDVRCFGLHSFSSEFAADGSLSPPLNDAVHLEAGDGGLCALTKRGQVVCHYFGPVEASAQSFAPRALDGSAVTGLGGRPIEVAKGDVYACARLDNGEVSCWDPFGTMTRIDVTDVTSLAAGDSHVCALHRDGSVSCWADGVTTNELGLPGNSVDHAVAKVEGLTDVARIDASGMSTCALRRDGSIWCWGVFADPWHASRAGGRVIAKPSPVEGIVKATQLGVGDGFACAVDDRGVWCWGAAVAGQLGDGRPVEVARPCAVGLEAKALHISAGLDHSCAVLEDGRVTCWGYRYGDDAITTGSGPAKKLVTGVGDAERVFSGEGRACAIRKGGAVSCWYPNPAKPVEALASPAVDAAWLDVASSCLAHRDGTVECAGDLVRPAEPVPGMAGVTQIESGSSDGVFVLTRAGEPVFFTLSIVPPRRVVQRSPFPGVRGAVDIASSAFRSCAVLAGGEISCGRLGGYGMPPRQPDKVKGAANAVEVACSNHGTIGTFMCYRSRAGTVHCVGDHGRGMLGDGRLASVPTDTFSTVADLDDAKAIAVGGAHACALRASGDVVCWGDNGYGQVNGEAGAYVSCPRAVVAAR